MVVKSVNYKSSDKIYKLEDGGILIAPVVLTDNWMELYSELIDQLSDEISDKVKKKAFIEIIFMTYSFVHRAINAEAFPQAIDLYNKSIMTGRGQGKYCYRENIKQVGEEFFRDQISKKLGNMPIIYIV